MFKPLPLAVQTAYQDLLEEHRHRPQPSIPGSIIDVQKSGRRYWISRQRIGSRHKEVQIGPDTAEVRERVEAARAEQQLLTDWARRCTILTKQLRTALPAFDMQTGKMLSALERAGVFAGGGILGGTNAYLLYQAHLGVEIRNASYRTEDVDVLATTGVSVVAPDEAGLLERIGELSLTPVAGPMEQHPVRWRMADGPFLDLLSPKGRKDTGRIQLPGLGVRAQTLSYLEYLMKEPVDAVGLYRHGVHVRIPSPERYAVHKMIVSSVRTKEYEGKIAKDLAQARSLFEVLLELRPDELLMAYEEASARGKKWRSALDKAVDRDTELGDMVSTMKGGYDL